MIRTTYNGIAAICSVAAALHVLAPTPSLAADLSEGQILVGHQVLGLSGTCARGLTHVDLESGEQYPLTIRSITSGANPTADGDIITWSLTGSSVELVRITPSTGAHRMMVIDDNDFTTPADVVEDANGDYVISNDSAVGRLERQTGIYEILSSGGDLEDPQGLAVAPNGDIFIADPTAGAVLRYQSTTGTSVFATGNLISAPRALAFADDGDLLVADGSGIVRVDPVSAAQSEFLAASAGVIGQILDITVNAAGDVFVVQDRPECDGDFVQRGLQRVPELSDPVPLLCVSTSDEPISSLSAVSSVAGGNDLIVTGNYENDGKGNATAVLLVDSDTVEVDVMSIDPPSGSFAFGPAGEFYVAVETRDALYQVDPRTGESEELASGGLLSGPRDVIVSDDGAFVFVLDDDGVIRVNPLTGAQAEVYDGAAFSDPEKIRRDRDGNFIIADLFAEDLIFLDSTTFDVTTITGGDIFRVVDVADPGSGDLLVADVGPNALIRVDRGTEAQSLVGDTGYFSPATPAAMLPEDDGNVLVTVGGAGALGLVRIDPGDGSQTIVSDLDICIGADLEHVVLAPAADLCGDPVDPPALSAPTGPGPRVVTASDALLVLQAGVGLTTCELCICDVNNSGSITATDALTVLQFAVGADVALDCPACGG